tara:strand:- start:238 stop:426 length:189 start_codon:yes stop_codon:yes gene_type:complete
MDNIPDDHQIKDDQHHLLDLTKFKHGHLIREIVQMYDKIDSPVLKATVTAFIASAALIDLEL